MVYNILIYQEKGSIDKQNSISYLKVSFKGLSDFLWCGALIKGITP